MPRVTLAWKKNRAGGEEDQQQLTQMVYEHTIGNKSKGISSKSRSEIASLMNRSGQWVWLEWNKLVKAGKLQKDPAILAIYLGQNRTGSKYNTQKWQSLNSCRSHQSRSGSTT